MGRSVILGLGLKDGETCKAWRSVGSRGLGPPLGLSPGWGVFLSEGPGLHLRDPGPEQQAGATRSCYPRLRPRGTFYTSLLHNKKGGWGSRRDSAWNLGFACSPSFLWQQRVSRGPDPAPLKAEAEKGLGPRRGSGRDPVDGGDLPLCRRGRRTPADAASPHGRIGRPRPAVQPPSSAEPAD